MPYLKLIRSLFYHLPMQADDYQALIDLALKEDLGERGDVTSQTVKEQPCDALLLSKDTGILAGSEIFQSVFKRIDAQTKVEFFFNDGQALKPGDKVALIAGKPQSILTAERTALNFLSFLSGIATQTRLFVEKARAFGNAQILDTRKTLPGFRALSKQAVKAGGGKNHRQGLYDMILIKDNHIDLAGSITKAVEHVQEKWGKRFAIEVECRNLQEVEETLGLNVDIIMLDNMNLAQIKGAAALTKARGKTKIEVSGGIDLDRIGTLSEAGIDYISVGKITHSVKAFDFSIQIFSSGQGKTGESG